MARLSPGEERLLEVFLKRLQERAPVGAIASVRVFGSRARGTSNEFSDLDVAVELMPGLDWSEHRFLGLQAAVDAMDDVDGHGFRLSPVVIPPISDDPTGLAANISREGVLIWRRD